MSYRITKKINTFGISNIKNYYLASIFASAYFFLPNWLFFFTLYMEKGRVGFIDGAGLLLGILLQIPTGAFSDLVGKRITILIGYFIQLVATIIIGIAHSSREIIIGNTLIWIGLAFVSGAIEAFAYDSMIEKKKEEKYTSVISIASFLTSISLIIASFLGGVFYAINPRLTFFAWGVCLFIAICAIFVSKEPVVDTDKFSIKGYFQKFKDGFTCLFSASLRKYSLLIITIIILFYLFTGFIRQSIGMYFGFDGVTMGYVISVMSIIAALSLIFFTKLCKLLKYYRFLIILLFIWFISFILPLFSRLKVIGLIVFVCISITSKLTYNLVQVIVNKNVGSKNRATTLSTLAMIGRIPYVIVMVLFSNVAEENNISKFFWACMIGILFIMVLEIIKLITYKNLLKYHNE